MLEGWTGQAQKAAHAQVMAKKKSTPVTDGLDRRAWLCPRRLSFPRSVWGEFPVSSS